MADRMEVEEGKIDESLYSRQLYVLDHSSMKQVMASNVLLIGLDGLGVEIAKNLVLTGIKSLTLHDTEPTSFFDLNSQFFLSEAHVGQTRARSCIEAIAQLNHYVDVRLHEDQITEAFLSSFQAVVVANPSRFKQIDEYNQVCRTHGVRFILAEARGVFALLFNDFGDTFVVRDHTDEPLANYMISSITREGDEIQVTLTEDQRLNLEDGSYISFSEIQGATELNGLAPLPIKVLGPFSFSVTNDVSFSPYEKGGRAKESRQPRSVSFKSLAEATLEPQVEQYDFAKLERPAQSHLAFRALHEFLDEHQKLPNVHNKADACVLQGVAERLQGSPLDEPTVKVLHQFSYGARAVLCPIAAFIGGIASQEVLKACSGKFMPIRQWFYFDATEALPDNLLTDDDSNYVSEVESRYSSQIAVFGKALNEKLLNLKYFIVGSGAIGCELIKNLAMMGIGAGPGGYVTVTDMDVIEKSNLSRQFLFRADDIGKLKSECAVAQAKRMNPNANYRALSSRVGAETESEFNTNFYKPLDGICNALDNIEARMYMDSQCVIYRKPLLESGTLGTKGNVQVVVPDKTESYASSADPPERSIPLCTLKFFPNRIEHTIQWARDLFEGLFVHAAQSANAYIQQDNFGELLRKNPVATQLDTLHSIESTLVSHAPKNFDDCVVWARIQFAELFWNNIHQLLYNYPLDMVTSSGAPFWSAPKLPPHPEQFNVNDDAHVDFLVAAANLRAQVFGIEGSTDRARIKSVAEQVEVPPFQPKSGVKIPANDAEAQAAAAAAATSVGGSDHEVDEFFSKLPNSKELRSRGLSFTELQFEKDDDTNFHIDFITAVSNLRATNYSIPVADKHTTKGIAGKIIPALVTTTAVVAGFGCIELIKIAQGVPIEAYKNICFNLALPLFATAEPGAVPYKTMHNGKKWTLWDRFELDGPLKLQQLIDYFQNEYELEVEMVSSASALLYSAYGPRSKTAERLKMELKEIYESISSKPFPASKSYMALDLGCVDSKGDDVEVPWVKYNLQ